MDGAELRRIRLQMGLTQKALAERLALHWNTVARQERDEMPISEMQARFIKLMRQCDRQNQPGRRSREGR